MRSRSFNCNMGKKRDKATGDKDCVISKLESSESPQKKHKKHKKKHKKQKHQDLAVDDGLPAIKLKLKIGGQTLGTKSISVSEVSQSKSKRSKTKEEPIPWQEEPVTKKVDTSDEEEKWLSALEKGELDDYGEVKKQNKDPSLLTARQRALLHGEKDDGHLLQLPSGYQPVKQLTEEQLQKRQMRAEKRQQQAKDKREKEKRLTMERLLKKQEKRGGKGRGARRIIPRYRYTNSQHGITVSVPEGFHFPYQTQPPKEKPIQQYCGVAGCSNLKKYACSKTRIALCSLGCYKKNVSLHKQIPELAVT